MTVGDGFISGWDGVSPRPTAYVHWEMERGGGIIDSGTLSMTKNRVLGFKEAGGFDKLYIGGYDDLATATSAISTTFQALALDNVKAQMVPEPSGMMVWSLIGLTFAGAGWWRRRRAA